MRNDSTKQNTLMKVETTLVTILSKMPNLNKARRAFLVHCFVMFLSVRGKINFLSLSRHSEAYVESSYRNHFAMDFDFSSFNSSLLLSSGSGHYVVALDMSYIRKSGKYTEGLGKYWSGASSRSEWGLEAGLLGVVDVDNHTAFHLEATQTPSKLEREKKGINYLSHCVAMVVKNKAHLEKISNYIVVDAYFTKKDFVLPLLEQTHLSVIGRLRDDANLNYLYAGEQKKGRGRPRKYEGKIHLKKPQWKHFKKVYQDKTICIYDAIVYAVFLKRTIRIALVQYTNKKGKTKQKIYFSTDTHLPAWLITKYYQARFQHEFIIRDAKQATGLQDCQARSRQKTEFHWNMALSTVNLAKIHHWITIQKEERKAFSIKDIKMLYHNKLLVDRFFSILQIEDDFTKNNSNIEQLYTFGTKAA